MYKNENLLIVISGPSGVGKGTIVKELIKNNTGFSLSVSATTRKPRDGETEGIHYYYKTKNEFEKLMIENAFLETFEIFENRYGTLKSDVFSKMANGKDVILEIDTQGGMRIKEQYPSAILVFILPPSFEELQTRLLGRNSESKESLVIRTASARAEIEKCNLCDYAVLNASVNGAVCDIMNIVAAEKMKVSRSQQLITEILGGNTL